MRPSCCLTKPTTIAFFDSTDCFADQLPCVREQSSRVVITHDTHTHNFRTFQLDDKTGGSTPSAMAHELLPVEIEAGLIEAEQAHHVDGVYSPNPPKRSAEFLV